MFLETMTIVLVNSFTNVFQNSNLCNYGVRLTKSIKFLFSAGVQRLHPHDARLLLRVVLCQPRREPSLLPGLPHRHLAEGGRLPHLRPHPHPRVLPRLPEEFQQQQQGRAVEVLRDEAKLPHGGGPGRPDLRCDGEKT